MRPLFQVVMRDRATNSDDNAEEPGGGIGRVEIGSNDACVLPTSEMGCTGPAAAGVVCPCVRVHTPPDAPANEWDTSSQLVSFVKIDSRPSSVLLLRRRPALTKQVRPRTGCFLPESCVQQGADRDEHQRVGSDKRHFLSEFVDRGVPDGEHRDPELAVDVVIALATDRL